MLVPWLEFGLSALAIVVAGYRLGIYGDEIASATGLSRAWVGLLLLATVTSLPELSTTITAGAIGAPDISLGNVFGSNLFNMAILFVMDMVGFWFLGKRGKPLLSRVGGGQLLNASAAILLSGLAVTGIALKLPEWWRLGPVSWGILLIYPLSIWALYRQGTEGASEERVPGRLGPALARFLLAAAVVVVAGMYLASSGKEIAAETRLTGTFMGALFIAASTSLPELMSCLGALRVGSEELLVGNLFGSNMFNVFTIPFADLAFKGGLLGAGGMEQVAVASLSIVLMALAAFGIQRGGRGRLLGAGYESWLILVGYLLGIYILFSRGIEF